jgi:hypothetical protein
MDRPGETVLVIPSRLGARPAVECGSVMPASHVLNLLAPFAIAAAWFVLFTILSGTMPSRLVPARGSQADANVGDASATVRPFDKAWMRWIWLAYVVYHFPVVVPGCWWSKNNTCPRWLLLLTPVLYAGVLYLLFVRR